MIEREFKVTGMHCASCVELIRETVGELAGVEQVAVSLEAERAIVRFDAERVTDTAVVDAIRDAGYDATPV